MPDESPPAPEPAAGKTIDLKGAQVTDHRTVGPLGGVLVVERPDGIPAEAWSGCDRIILRALRPEEDESEDAVARLREDVEALVGIEHPGLFRVLGFAKHKNDEFVALECPSGETLQSMVARREPPPEKAVDVAREVAAALCELARAGRPHRDFSTSAVFVARDGSARVVPMACPREFRVEARASSRDTYRGEPLYAAPELHETGGLDPTQRSNIFAFGVALYQMLCYQVPFRGGTPTRLLLDVAGSDPRPPSNVVPDLPPELDGICLRCMEKDPERRYPGFAAIESTLRIAAESVAFGKGPASGRAQSTRELATPEPAGAPAPSAPLSTRTTSRSTSARRMSGRQKGLLAASAAVVVAALGLVALAVLAGRSSDPPPETIASDVYRRAQDLIDEEKYGKAWRLLDSHRGSVRDVDPSRFDELIRTARASDWIQQGKAAQEEGRWEAAASAFEKALAESKGPEDVALRARLDESLYRAELDRAEAAERSDDWQAVARALEKAISLGKKRGMPESGLEGIREDAAFVQVMIEAAAARDAGDASAERECLFRAAGLRRGNRAVMKRLAALGAGPKAAEEALARAKKAFEAGERSEAERLAKEASQLWPADERPAQVLVYFADRSYCELNNSVFVSSTGPWESWGPAERAKAFCIDPYEFRDEGARLPRTRVSGLEAVAQCRKVGGRLCRVAEWQLACSGPEGRAFPYGNRYAFDACNTAGNGPASPGTARDCRSPFGAHDMSGNVAEWTAEYLRGKGQVVAGGDWSSGESGSTCRSVIHFEPKLSSPRVGFRCCRSIPGAADPGP
ncbi:MAG: protein kinase [Planctomycetota bacterium]|jgi:serine/threonine protein kinase